MVVQNAETFADFTISPFFSENLYRENMLNCQNSQIIINTKFFKIFDWQFVNTSSKTASNERATSLCFGIVKELRT